MRTSFKLSGIVIFFLFLTFQSKLAAQINWNCFSEENAFKLSNVFDYGGMVVLPDSSRWFFVQKEGIFIYKNNEWSKIDKSNHLIKNTFSKVLIDTKKRFWIGTKGPSFLDGWGASSLFKGGVGIYNSDEGKWEDFTKKEIGIQAPNVSYIYEDKDGAIWIALTSADNFSNNSSMHKGGIIKYHDEEITVYDSYPNDYCKFANLIFEDVQGKLWFSTLGGLMFYDEGQFQLVNKKEYGMGMRDPIIMKNIDQGKLWIGAIGKLSMWDGKSWHIYNKQNGLNKNSYPLRIAKWKDQPIFITNEGIYTQSDTENWDKIPFQNPKSRMGYPQRIPLFIVFDSHDNLLVFYNNNFVKFNGTEWTQEVIELNNGPFLLDSKDRFWAENNDGITYLENGQWYNKNINAWKYIEDANQNIWIITKDEGVYMFDNNEYTHYDQETFLNSSKITMGHLDSMGSLWIGTEKGCCFCEILNE